MLACLQDNNQVRKVVCFFAFSEKRSVILLVVFVTELFEDVEHDLRVDSRHPKCLQEASHAFLDAARESGIAPMA